MKRAALVLSSFALVALAAAACGGANDSDLFGPTGSPSQATSPTEPGNGSGTGTEEPGGGSGKGASSSSSSSSSSSGGSSSSSSSSGGTSSGGASSSSGGASSSGGWKSPGIYCGTAPNGADVNCPSSSEVCCIARNDAELSSQCKPSSQGQYACGQQAITLRCNDQTDCPSGQVCCGTFDQAYGYRSTQCQTSCQATQPGTTSVRFCDPDAPVDECAAIGKACQPSSSLTGYSICK